ncbi:hypothetical protein EV663_11141 [Rhodovulum bhavnagarense]|uniref:Uncharacterized protein n=1 Tax=Rhodovulum bhavnagarense TaxID=992286 RepID=A0A4R2RCU0_9RHOB|nr:hypothetical protein [Rhodovulum bhavnagarense]TCP60254.1 hypothetical protein EV663_11141 [Rhodovulum bhavnagarense]
MSFWHSVACAAVVAGFIVSAAEAQSLRKDDGPAELPPASYQDRQYVDSQGCVYIRAGYAGQVTWVPRVGRDRKVLCGYKPSLASAVPQPKIATRPAPVRTAQTSQRTVPKVGAAAKSAQPVQPVRVLRKPAPQPGPAAAPAPKRVVRAAPPVQAAPQKQVRRGKPACAGASPLSSQYINDGSRYPVRCGPQVDDPRGLPVPQGGARVERAATRDVLRPVPFQMPKGYENVWEDDRLNPMRGKRSERGDAQMALIWTDDVPARLVEIPVEQMRAVRLSTSGKK